jgi:serine protease AprX
VIVHGTGADLHTIAARHGVHIARVLNGGAVLEANAAQIDALAAEPSIQHLSGDLPVADFMTVSTQATLADKVRAGQSGGLLGLGGISGVNGQGVVVAILDSGISAHRALTGKVLASVSMIAGQPTADEYGHGTHVAGIITGTGAYSAGVTSQYAGGIAPGAQLVNVRVLGDDGVGNTSDVIAGIDWVIANKARYNIKLMNLSLGHAVTEPVAFDPLCAAVERAYRAGSSSLRPPGMLERCPTERRSSAASLRPAIRRLRLPSERRTHSGLRHAMTTRCHLFVPRPDEVRQQRQT